MVNPSWFPERGLYYRGHIRCRRVTSACMRPFAQHICPGRRRSRSSGRLLWCWKSRAISAMTSGKSWPMRAGKMTISSWAWMAAGSGIRSPRARFLLAGLHRFLDSARARSLFSNRLTPIWSAGSSNYTGFYPANGSHFGRSIIAPSTRNSSRPKSKKQRRLSGSGGKGCNPFPPPKPVSQPQAVM